MLLSPASGLAVLYGSDYPIFKINYIGMKIDFLGIPVDSRTMEETVRIIDDAIQADSFENVKEPNGRITFKHKYCRNIQGAE